MYVKENKISWTRLHISFFYIILRVKKVCNFCQEEKYLTQLKKHEKLCQKASPYVGYDESQRRKYVCKFNDCNRRLKTRAGANIHFSKIHSKNSKRNKSQDMGNGNEFSSPLNSAHPRKSTSTSGKKIGNNFL